MSDLKNLTAIIVVTTLYVLLSAFSAFVSYAYGLDVGRQQRLDMTLNTRQVSEELEMACLSLWIGEQNKKYAEKLK